MKSLDHVIDAILAHLRSWPAFYAAPEPDPVGRIPVDSPADGLTPDGRTPDGLTPDNRTPDGWIPQMPPASAAPIPGGRAWDGRPLSHRILGRRAADGRTPEAGSPIGRCCYRVAPTEWGIGATPPAEETPSRPNGGDPPARQASARRRSSSFLTAGVLPQPRGLLTCNPQSPERSRRTGGGIALV